MFDKISRAAERAATGVSRRNFLGQLGRGAAVVAAGLGGVLATATDAEAGYGWCCFVGYRCCLGKCPKGSTGTTFRCMNNACPRCDGGATGG